MLSTPSLKHPGQGVGDNAAGCQGCQRPQVDRAVRDMRDAQAEEREEHNHRRAEQTRLEREDRGSLRLTATSSPIDTPSLIRYISN